MRHAMRERRGGTGLGQPWSPADLEKLLKLINDGLGVPEIAKKLNCKAERVRDKLKNLSYRDGAKRPRTTTRKCLCCRENFPSEGAGDRVCRRCESTEGWRFGYMI